MTLIVIVHYFFSMHWYQRPSVCTIESGPPLSEPQGQIYQLHLCGRESRTDVVAGRTFGSEFFATHTRSDWLRIDYSCGRQQNRAPSAPNHSRPYAIQTCRQRGRIFTIGHVIKNEQSRIASSQR